MFSVMATMRSCRAWLGKRPKLVIAGLVLTAFIYWLASSGRVSKFGHEYLRAIPCEDSEAKNVLMEICSLYNKRQIVGGLCKPLCQQKHIEFIKCLNYKNGKYVVQVECGGICKPHEKVPAVLKMTRIDGSELLKHLEGVDGELLLRIGRPGDIGKLDAQNPTITAESLSVLTTNLLDSEYGFTAREDQDVLSLLWGDDYPNYFENTVTTLAFGRSFWSVVKQNEYRISNVFKEWDVFPQIYGNCGPLYLAEHAPGLKAMNSIFPFLTTEFPSWQSRAKLAIEILKLVQRMDNMEHPLHLCDIKSPHFGYSEGNTVRFIDADTVFTDSTLLRDLGDSKCTQHEDCAFFDCEGWCNKQEGKCMQVRTNNNLQTVCAKIFRGGILSAYSGLLSTPPKSLAAKLTTLINSCADDITEHNGDIKIKMPGQELLSTLERYLLESLNADLI